MITYTNIILIMLINNISFMSKIMFYQCPDSREGYADNYKSPDVKDQKGQYRVRIV